MIALLFQSVQKERGLLLSTAVRMEAGMNPVIGEVVRLGGHPLKSAKMAGLVLLQVVAAVPLVDKPLHRTVAAENVFEVFRFKDERIRLRGEKGPRRRNQ